MDAASLLELVTRVLRTGLPVVAVGTLGFGLYSAVVPRASIALYQALMAWCNWRVTPIDARRELRTTRALGLALSALSVCTLALLGGR